MKSTTSIEKKEKRKGRRFAMKRQESATICIYNQCAGVIDVKNT